MDANDDKEFPGPEETGSDDPERPDGPDEQVALDRLTAAFAELLGTDEPRADEQAADEQAADELATEKPAAEGEADEPAAAATTTDDEPTILPVTAALAAAPVPLVPRLGEPGWEPDEPSFPISPRAILEAMLFVGDPQSGAISPRQAAARLRGVSPREVEELVEELNETYRAEGCPYTIESSGEGFRLSLRSEFAAVRERFYGRIREARLSQAAIDVLSLVAYHQPIARNRVDEIRGKPSGGILSQLVRRQLLRIERTESKPRVTTFFTTDRFLELFALDGLQDLPRTQDLDKGG